MAAPNRTANQTTFGISTASVMVGAVNMAPYLTDGSATIDTEIGNARSLTDLDTMASLGVSKMSVDFSQIVVKTAQPMMAIALSATPNFEGSFRHAVTGDVFANNTTATPHALWLLTSAKLSVAENNATESWSAVLQGAPAWSQPVAVLAPAVRTDLADTALGKAAVGSLAIGGAGASAYDMLNFFDSFDIDVSIGTGEAHAALDRWTWPNQTERKITINASRLVEAPAAVEGTFTTPTKHLAWLYASASGNVVGVSIQLGAKTYAGNFAVTSAKWNHNGTGGQKETISLENIGAVSVA